MEPSKNNEAAPAVALPQKIKRINKRRILIWLAILLISAALYFLITFFLSPTPSNYGDMINVNTTANKINVIQNNLIATTTDRAKSAQAISSSENFDLMQINLEGSGTDVFDLGENELFTLGSVTSELYSVKQGETSEIRAAISCQTSKRSNVEVEYFKSGSKDKKIIKDAYPGFSHMLVIPTLDPDSVYKYSIIATNLNQTKIYSDQFVFYTGAGNVSLVDILGGAVQKVFGWVLGK